MVGDSELSRIGISLPQNLLDKFDGIIGLRGYSSRSEGIRDAIRSYITYYEWMSDVKGERQGVITMVYDHDHRGLMQTITEIQHENRDTIQSTLHAHVNDERCQFILRLHNFDRYSARLTHSSHGISSVPPQDPF